jgi:hypothetical protein
MDNFDSVVCLLLTLEVCILHTLTPPSLRLSPLTYPPKPSPPHTPASVQPLKSPNKSTNAIPFDNYDFGPTKEMPIDTLFILDNKDKYGVDPSIDKIKHKQHCLAAIHKRLVLEETALQCKGIRSQFYCPMSASAILYVGYGLPNRVPNTGSHSLYSLLTGSFQYSQLSLESEIRPLHRTVLDISSLLTSLFFNSKVTTPIGTSVIVRPTHSCCQTFAHNDLPSVSLKGKWVLKSTTCKVFNSKVKLFAVILESNSYYWTQPAMLSLQFLNW